MSELLKRMKSVGTIKVASILSESSLFNAKDMITTPIPALNIALSGRIDGGLTPGLSIIAGPSRHFKSMFGLIMVRAYMQKYKDAICLYYDSEFGTTPEYNSSIGIDADRVLHIPIIHIEQLKFDISKRLEEIKRGDKIIIFIDSVGNLASKRESDNALSENSAEDMSRAKVLKSLFRIITPHLTLKDIPCIVINHVYNEMGMFPKTIMSGGQGPMLSSNQVFIIGKQQEKDGTELVGYNFIINVEKSRFVKEKSKIPIEVLFKGGISRWSGLLDIAIAVGGVIKPSNGWYSRVDMETGEIAKEKYRMKDTYTSEFWMPILKSKAFQAAVQEKYQVSSGSIIQEEDYPTDIIEL